MNQKRTVSVTDEAIYQAYPKHVAKQDALKAIRKVLSQGIQPDDLLTHVEAYATAVTAWPEADRRRFVPYPATWFNAGRYLDDPREWVRASPEATDSAKNSSGGAPAGPFDPSKPHAHTGGVEVVS